MTFFGVPCNHLQYSESAQPELCSPGWSGDTPRPFLIPSSLNFKSQTQIPDSTCRYLDRDFQSQTQNEEEGEVTSLL